METGLNPKVKELLEMLHKVKPFYETSLEEARKLIESKNNPFLLEPIDLKHMEDRKIPGPGGDLPIRIYTPHTNHKGPLPALVFYHGGGFVMGSIESHDTIAQHLAAESGCMVISVEYRLSPETKFPGAVDDATAAFRWISTHGQAIGVATDKIAVGGDSAGGNLAAVVSLRCRDEGGPIPSFQLLIYPITDLGGNTASRQNFSQGYFLDKNLMNWFRSHYLIDPSQLTHPYASPLLAPDHTGLPGALIITAGFDPLRDEGEAYSAKLNAAGVPANYMCYQDMIHGFLSFGGVLKEAQSAIKECASALRKAFELERL